MSSQRPPTADTVEHLARRVLGPGAGRSVRPIDEGGEHASWWVDADHVVRFALDADGADRQRREIALRDLLRPVVGVEIPASVGLVAWAGGLTATFDTRLPGVSAEVRTVAAVGEADLARMLIGLRSLPAASAAALGVPAAQPRALEALRQAAESAVELLHTGGEFDAARWAALGPSAPARSPADVVLHNDLKGEHVLVADTGGVCGVLDWTDAAIGDPAEDVAGL
ncbi:aminoglycoside phosphotransferase family protein, partial [Streptomyces sp. SID3343]|uniref:aminoglycoside phosphotransferase family protein n=1 Tax=Streptomyces sp. SID3343 TaxID=2690260 RepID=UPI00136B6067